MKALFTILSFLVTLSIYGQNIVFVKQDAAGSGDGTSWTNAFTDLQIALDAAVEGSQVWIAAGNYIPQGSTPQTSHFWMLTPLKLYGGFAGNETSLSERDWQVNQTILNGDKNGDDVVDNFNTKRTDNAHHVLILDASSSESLMDGLIFQGGTTRVDGYVPDSTDNYINRWFGGALFVFKSPITVRNSIFRQNNSFRGAGIFIVGNPPEIIPTTIENSIFEKNTSAGIGNGRGGGIYIVDAESSSIINSKFIGNKATEGGGGIAAGNANSNVSGCEFHLNEGKLGGGIIFFRNTSGKIAHTSHAVTNCTFLENTAYESGGGIDVYNISGGFSIHIDSCIFEKNKCTNIYGDGGAMSMWDQADIISSEKKSEISITNTTVRECEAGFTGGILISADDDSMDIKINHVNVINNKGYRSGGGLNIGLSGVALLDVEILNTVFDSNTADLFRGGAFEFGVFENKYSPSILIDSCRFTNNVSAGYGGAYTTFIYNTVKGPNSIIRNSHFADNIAAGTGGALCMINENATIENTTFKRNYSFAVDSDFNGGGAITLYTSKLTLKNSKFERNISEDEGADLFLAFQSKADIENVLFYGSLGKNSIYSQDTLILRNVSMMENVVALTLDTNSVSTIQNSIFSSAFKNLVIDGPSQINSRGSNISTDNTMADVLTGYGAYDDMNDTDPKLNIDFVPEKGSPAIDASNPEGVTSLVDLAGNPRMQGGAIDIGSFESLLTAVKDAIWNDPAISVYPNPVSDILNLKLESSWLGETRILIYNQLGQQVYNVVKNKDGNIEVFAENVLSLAHGQYIVLVKAGQQTYASTIIIQR